MKEAVVNLFNVFVEKNKTFINVNYFYNKFICIVFVEIWDAWPQLTCLTLTFYCAPLRRVFYFRLRSPEKLR